MNDINELELRALIKRKLSAKEQLNRVIEAVLDTTLSWEIRRSFWSYLFATRNYSTLLQAMKVALESKNRVPFEFFLDLAVREGEVPKSSVIESFLKGIKKQGSLASLIPIRGLDKWDNRFGQIRREIVEEKLLEQRKFKEGLLEKFAFLHSQRMTDQAGRVLRRMVELFPEDQEIAKLKSDFDEQHARDVLSTHLATLQHEKIERTHTEAAPQDREMISHLAAAGLSLARDKSEVAEPLAYAFLFMDEITPALEVLRLAKPTLATDWLRAELLLLGRRFLEGLELLNELELKYVADPETTFAVSYLRARCLKGLGQHSAAIDILKSIVRVRPGYRSAHSLILEWTEGVSWE